MTPENISTENRNLSTVWAQQPTRFGYPIVAEIIVSVKPETAVAILEAVGAERDEAYKTWVFPDNFTTGATEEALAYAIEALPTVVFNAM